MCSELRTHHRFAGILVILSADDDDEANARYLTAGADASMSKCTLESGRTMAEQLIEVVARAADARTRLAHAASQHAGGHQ